MVKYYKNKFCRVKHFFATFHVIFFVSQTENRMRIFLKLLENINFIYEVKNDGSTLVGRVGTNFRR